MELYFDDKKATFRSIERHGLEQFEKMGTEERDSSASEIF
jgi:hypothetical protein